MIAEEYRLIVWCNVTYKVLSKILAERLKPLLPDLINPTQGGFVKGRSITDNVLLYHELVQGYDRKNISPRMVIKADLKKAYDSVNWEFLRQLLHQLGFPKTFLNWIVLCVQSPWFSLNKAL